MTPQDARREGEAELLLQLGSAAVVRGEPTTKPNQHSVGSTGTSSNGNNESTSFSIRGGVYSSNTSMNNGQVSTPSHTSTTSKSTSPVNHNNVAATVNTSNSSSTNTSNSTMKKKKKRDKVSRRSGKDRTVHKATDSILHAQSKLESALFPRDGIIPKPSSRQREIIIYFAEESQFEDAPEHLERAQLKQYHSSSAGGMKQPPFGYLSLHPSVLSLHPEYAVQFFYPSTSALTAASLAASGVPGDAATSSAIASAAGAASTSTSAVAAAMMGNSATMNHSARGANFHPGFRPPMMGRSGAGYAAERQVSQSGLSQFHHSSLGPLQGVPSSQQQMHKAMAGMSPTTGARPITSALTGMHQHQQHGHYMTPQQQQTPSFLEYVEAMKRQQHAHEQQQLREQQFHHHQQEARLLQQEAMQQEQLKAMSEKAAMRHMKSSIENMMAAGQMAQAQQQSSMQQQREAQLRLEEQHQQQQKEHAAVVMASLSQQPGPSLRASAVAEAEENLNLTNLARAASQDQSGPVSAMMALAAAREEMGQNPAAAVELVERFRLQQPNQHKQKGSKLSPQHHQQQADVTDVQQVQQQQKARMLSEIHAMSAAMRPSSSSSSSSQRQLPPQDFSSAIMAKKMKPKIAGQDDGSSLSGDRKKQPILASGQSPLTTGTEQLETLPMLRYTPPDTEKRHPVTESEIRDCDVLLGRGGMTNHHVGNMHFRVLVAQFRIHYCTAKKGAKGQLSKKLTNFVRHKGGRFLQKDDVDNLWYECGDQRAHGKCAQALREGTAELMKQVEEEGTVIPGLENMLGRSRGNSTASDSDTDDSDLLNGYREVSPSNKGPPGSGSMKKKAPRAKSPKPRDRFGKPSQNEDIVRSAERSSSPRASGTMSGSGAMPSSSSSVKAAIRDAVDREMQARRAAVAVAVSAHLDSRRPSAMMVSKPRMGHYEDNENNDDKEDDDNSEEGRAEEDDDSDREERSVTSEDEARRKRQKVQHVDENELDYM